MTTAQALLEGEFALCSDIVTAHARERPDALALIDELSCEAG